MVIKYIENIALSSEKWHINVKKALKKVSVGVYWLALVTSKNSYLLI